VCRGDIDVIMILGLLAFLRFWGEYYDTMGLFRYASIGIVDTSSIYGGAICERVVKT
jgi:hypothetical protein